MGQTKEFNQCIYNLTHKEHNVGSTAIRKIVHNELDMEKKEYVVLQFNNTLKVERVRTSKQTLKSLNEDGRRISSKIITGDVSNVYKGEFGVPTRQECKE